eukprot:scaffold24864_cov25-Prasinocladus_malaysianus.AAC.1
MLASHPWRSIMLLVRPQGMRKAKGFAARHYPEGRQPGEDDSSALLVERHGELRGQVFAPGPADRDYPQPLLPARVVITGEVLHEERASGLQLMLALIIHHLCEHHRKLGSCHNGLTLGEKLL